MVAIEIGHIVQDFTVIMVVASVMALVSYKLKQPMVIGYIIAGMIIGPYTPPFSLVVNLDVQSIFRNWNNSVAVCCRNGISY
jgi:monovalent cation:H+ antiporter-2, CPA2 family